MIRGTTRLAAVIGWPVDHSRSPQMLNTAFAERGVDAVLVPIGVPPDQLGVAVAGLRAARALGASVTVPHKVAVAGVCDQLSPAARAIGAVNCLHFTDTDVVGHNTDAEGFIDSLVEAGCAQPPHVVLLGAGGAARAVAFGLRAAKTIELVARDVGRASWIGPMQKVVAKPNGTKLVATPWSELRAALARADLVVDCTSIGLSGLDEEAITDTLPLDAIRREAWVTTLVYHRPTILLESARERGHPTLDGRGMLVHQGARAFAIWTNMQAPVEAMRHALDEALRGT
jgi:shikimate dehydrogenase